MPLIPRRSLLTAVAVFTSIALSGVAVAGAVTVAASDFQDLRWRLLGPFRGGWATAVAGIPGDPATFYFGGADGGVWKTTDAGVTWKPIFERAEASSIGALAIAPSDPRVIWIGTGQVHQRWDIVSGHGVFRSTNGGASWTPAGLAETRHIGKIWVDPRNADIAIVAALGHVFGANEERGLLRTENGGQSWTKVLYRDADTGAVEIVGDPANPEMLYAALWQVRRYPWLDYFQPAVGPGSGVYRSSDGGRTWAAAGKSGWPEGDLGRIALAVAPGSQGRKVWAAVSGKGLFGSSDGGVTWALLNSDGDLAGSYIANLTPDPRDPATLWVMGRGIQRSTDGGKSFTFAKGAPGGDDYHILWIDPTDSRRMITGADQGAVLSLNGGTTWSSWYNQPTGQFYRLAADRRFPYWVYSGQQDSGTVAIASRSDYGQLTFRDWHPVGGDERDGDLPDPVNPDIVYGAGLGGRLSKWNARTGEVQNVSPWPIASYGARPGSTRYRYSWITPVAISPRPPHAIYQGAQVLFRSTDGGASWSTVSPDLTGAVPVAPGTAGCDGDVPVERASGCGYGVIFAIAPSPAADGEVWIGTDNGRVQLTRDDGKSWQEVTPAALGDWSKVNTIDASASDPGTAYLAADRHRLDEIRPIAFRTHDFGATWVDIGRGLPQDEWLGALRQDAKREGLLYAGTNRGVYVSFDDGESWQSLQLNLPTTGINDLLVQGDDLLVATQGRGLWALDVIAPLRHLPPADRSQVTLLPPAAATRLRMNQNKDTPLPPEEPRGENPPTGAVLDYLLPRAAQGPVVLEIYDANGQRVRRFASDEVPDRPRSGVYFTGHWLAAAALPVTTAGHHRFVWDLCRERPHALDYEYSIAAIPGRETPPAPQGALVPPGSYEVRLTVEGVVRRQPLSVVADPRLDLSAAGYAELDRFQGEVAKLLADSATLATATGAFEARLEAAGKSSSARVKPLLQAARRSLAELKAGDDSATLNGRLSGLAADLESADALPTAPQREVAAECSAQLERLAERWREFAKRDLPRLERRFARAGSPLR